jgi:ribosomal protein L37AE/L43A
MGWGNSMPKCPECGKTDYVGRNDDGITYHCTECDEIFYEDGTRYNR